MSKKDWRKIVLYSGVGGVFALLVSLLVAKRNAYNSMEDHRDRLFNDSIDSAQENNDLMGKLADYKTELRAYKDSLKQLNQKLEDCSKPKKVVAKKKKPVVLKKKTPSAIDSLRYPPVKSKTSAEKTVIINGDNNNVVINPKDNVVKETNDTIIRFIIKKRIEFKINVH